MSTRNNYNNNASYNKLNGTKSNNEDRLSYNEVVSQIKPRRLEDNIAEYLMKIEMQLTKDSMLDDDEKNNLIENVLSEVSQRTASASCDRRTNFLIEKLARNRYSSHMLQVL